MGAADIARQNLRAISDRSDILDRIYLEHGVEAYDAARKDMQTNCEDAPGQARHFRELAFVKARYVALNAAAQGKEN